MSRAAQNPQNVYFAVDAADWTRYIRGLSVNSDPGEFRSVHGDYHQFDYLLGILKERAINVICFAHVLNVSGLLQSREGLIDELFRKLCDLRTVIIFEPFESWRDSPVSTITKQLKPTVDGVGTCLVYKRIVHFCEFGCVLQMAPGFAGCLMPTTKGDELLGVAAVAPLRGPLTATKKSSFSKSL